MIAQNEIKVQGKLANKGVNRRVSENHRKGKL